MSAIVRRTTMPFVALLLLFVALTSASAGPTPEQACRATKNKLAGKYVGAG